MDLDFLMKLSALAERDYGEAKSYKNIVFVEVSNCIGAGLIVDNHFIRGANGSAGEIGFTIVGTSNLNYKAKIKGFLEKHASIESIKEKAVEQVKKGKKTSILTLSIISLILILNPEIIVFGGDICNLPGKKELFLEPIKTI